MRKPDVRVALLRSAGCPKSSLQQHLLVAAVPAVLLAVTQPLGQETLPAVFTVQLGGAGDSVAAALLIRLVTAVWVAVAVHGGLHTLSTGALEVCSTTALGLWGAGERSTSAAATFISN